MELLFFIVYVQKNENVTGCNTGKRHCNICWSLSLFIYFGTCTIVVVEWNVSSVTSRPVCTVSVLAQEFWNLFPGSYI